MEWHILQVRSAVPQGRGRLEGTEAYSRTTKRAGVVEHALSSNFTILLIIDFFKK